MADSQTLGEPLTQAEVDALPDGAKIFVKWSGGNGPHKYTLRRNSKYPQSTPVAMTDSQIKFGGYAGFLSMCGKHPQNQVWKQ